MKRRYFAIAACSSLLACSERAGDDDGALGQASQALNGALTTGGNLTKKGPASTDEFTRQLDTDAYYTAVRIGSNGTSGSTIKGGLATLSAFKTNYGFGAGDTVTRYFNRGDLGIGREMHCVDTFATNGQVACYVKNFAAGSDNSEFTFGFSTNIAFANMAADHAFATVAMVYRNAAPAKNKVFFAVYDAAGNLAKAAALDRHGLTFANAFNGTSNPPAQFGTPGQTFNNHIPSNCMSCHGGSYDATDHSGTQSLFLPFDLDQFEYEDVAGKRRVDQLTAFKRQNEMVRKVASNSLTTTGTNVTNQLDTWYGGNPSRQTNANEVFELDFNSAALPSGWSADAGVYQAVVRPMCRSCHLTSPIAFNDAASFNSFAPVAVTDLCDFKMPHALQTVRQFWLSSAPATLEGYLRSKGNTTDADRLKACGPRNVVTLDPQLIATSSGVFNF